NRRNQRFPHPEISADPLYEGVLNAGAPRHHALTVNQPTITDVAHTALSAGCALTEQINQPVTHSSSTSGLSGSCMTPCPAQASMASSNASRLAARMTF